MSPETNTGFNKPSAPAECICMIRRHIFLGGTCMMMKRHWLDESQLQDIHM